MVNCPKVSVPEKILPFSTQPIKPTEVLKVTTKLGEILTSASLSKANTNLDAFLSTVKPLEYDNPWDWVPDQPLKTGLNSSRKNSSSTCDKSR